MTGNYRIPKANSRIPKDKSRISKPCVILRYIFTTPIKPIFDIFSPLIIWYQNLIFRNIKINKLYYKYIIHCIIGKTKNEITKNKIKKDKNNKLKKIFLLFMSFSKVL